MPPESRIRVLSEGLANQIAAGEVVQRPASVLKELIENSLDAGARRVEVDLESGGSRSIRVRDDGGGMGPDDALLAFERHATSKISAEEDLHRLETLGFRGEALPSIAAVSKVSLTTRRRGDEMGAEVRIEGGRVLRVGEMGAPEGTQIEVRSLFYNVPARRKFLKRKETELARSVEVISRAAMANPETGFILRHGGRTLLELKAGEDRLGRAAQLIGVDSLPHLLEIAFKEDEDLSVTGWAGAPSINKSGRDGQYLFVNARPVRDRLLVHAVYEAYRSFMPTKRHPVFVLFVDVPSESVDVNVHPSKEEVRFRQASRVHDAVREAVAASLGAPPVGRPQVAIRRPEPAYARSGEGVEPLGGGGGPIVPPPALVGGGAYFPKQAEAGPQEIEEKAAEIPDLSGMREYLSGGSSDLERVLKPPSPSNPVRLSECRYLGQWEGCFLLFASSQGLVFVDQHAAHERVLYNRFRDQFRESRVEAQASLVPQAISLRPEEALRLESHRGTLERSGFELEPTAPGDYLIRAVPALLAERDPAGAVRRIVEGLAELDEPMSFPDLIDGVIARMSCRGAIKAAQSLHPEEVAALVEEIERTPGHWTCPHGRPLMLVLGAGAVQRRFLRT